jgi:hypothetical protein
MRLLKGCLQAVPGRCGVTYKGHRDVVTVRHNIHLCKLGMTQRLESENDGRGGGRRNEWNAMHSNHHGKSRPPQPCALHLWGVLALEVLVGAEFGE